MTGTQAILTGLVFLLAIRHGEGGLSTVDLSLIGVAGAGVIGWLVAGQPVLAVACVIVADLSAAAMMRDTCTARVAFAAAGAERAWATWTG